MGAEAVIQASQFLTFPTLCKSRVTKRYRVSVLDERINKQRLLQEARCLVRCRTHGVNVPILYFVDTRSKSLFVEHLRGETLKATLGREDFTLGIEIMQQLGIQVAKMHSAGVIHGDLTSSNVMVSADKVFLIDFGLSQMKGNIEDKAVDLYVLEKALSSSHSSRPGLFDAFLRAYSDFPNTKDIVTRYHAVRARGRKRSMLG